MRDDSGSNRFIALFDVLNGFVVGINTQVPQNIKNRYRDLNLSFLANPVSEDIGVLTDADAVKQAVVNLVLTKHYERPFHPEIGCNVTSLLFDNISPLTASNIQRSIQDVIDNFEPRVKTQQIVVNADSDNNGYNVTIYFYVLNNAQLQSLTTFLERLR